MQKLISKYGAAAHLAILAVSPLFLFPFTGSVWTARTLMWLSALALVWLTMEPSRRAGELPHDARSRVAHAIVTDPLLYVLVTIVAACGLRWANAGVAMAYDAETFLWSLKGPACAIFPGVVSGSGELEFSASLAAAVVITGCRHSLGKSARISFLFTASLLAGAAALSAAVAAYLGHEGAIAMMNRDFSTPVFIGSAFGVYFLGSIIALVGALEIEWNRLLPILAFSMGATAVGLFFFAPSALIALYLAAGLFLFLASAIYSGITIGVASSLKCLAAFVLGSLVPILFALALMPDGLADNRLAVFTPDGTWFPANFDALKSTLSTISRKIWSNHPWLGTGVGSYSLALRFNASPEDWAFIDPSRASAATGWWTLLSERGLVGAIFLALPLGFLLFTYFRRAIGILRGKTFVPAAILAPTVIGVVIAETFFDSSFLRPEILISLGAFLAIAACAFPAKTATAVAESDSETSAPAKGE